MDNYRKSRLFLTPDHASTTLYQHIARQIADAVGVKIDECFFWRRREVQYGVQLPILPSVARALDLEFCDGDFYDELAFGPRLFRLTEYLKLFYYEKDIRLARPKCVTRLRAYSDDTGPKPRQVGPKDMFLVRLIKGAGEAGRQRMDVLGGKMGGELMPRAPDRSSLYYAPHWQMSRTRKPVVDPTEKTVLPAA